LFGLATAIAYIAVSTDRPTPADGVGTLFNARPNRRSPCPMRATLDIVVDANNGAVLHASNADALRHPASLTKNHDALSAVRAAEAGKLKLDSDLEVSAHAASQSPTKLGLGRARPSRSRTRSKASSPARQHAAVVVAESLATARKSSRA